MADFRSTRQHFEAAATAGQGDRPARSVFKHEGHEEHEGLEHEPLDANCQSDGVEVDEEPDLHISQSNVR